MKYRHINIQIARLNNDIRHVHKKSVSEVLGHTEYKIKHIASRRPKHASALP